MKQRPWRLARGERVRMEAALSSLRVSASDGTIMGAARALDRAVFDIIGERWRTYDLSPEWRRIARARLAIAIRAALRADEDARCEEVRARVSSFYSEADYERSEMRGAAEDWCDSLREWPPLRSVAYEWPDGVPVPPSVLMFHVPYVGTFVLPSRVPRALWDR